MDEVGPTRISIPKADPEFERKEGSRFKKKTEVESIAPFVSPTVTAGAKNMMLETEFVWKLPYFWGTIFAIDNVLVLQ